MYETYNVIASSISTIRLLLRQQIFSIPENTHILDAYQELAIFIITNFNLPSTHEGYIAKNLGIPENLFGNKIIIELENHLKNIKGNFSLELPLRALEVYFSFGRPLDIDMNILMELKYLISKLHHLVGENYEF